MLTIFLIFSTFCGPRLQPVESASILAIETIAGKSHWFFFSSVLRSLMDKGHHVNVFTPITKGNREKWKLYRNRYARWFTKEPLDRRTWWMCSAIQSRLYGSVHTPGITRSYCDIIHVNERLKYILEGFVHTDFDVILIEPVWLDCILIYYFLKFKICD